MPVLHGAWVLAEEADGGSADGAELRPSSSTASKRKPPGPPRATLPAAFALWGESDPTTRKPRPAARPRRGAPVPYPPAHPFALTGDALRHALSTLELTAWATRATVASAIAVLPSASEAPLRSDGPADAAPEGEGEGEPHERVALRPWSIPVLVLSEVAVEVVLPRIAAATAEHSVRIGPDLRAWVVAARFALSLLVRQRFVPGIRVEGERLTARWSPAIDDPGDAAALRAVVEGLPSAAIALAWTHPGQRTTKPATAVADFVAAVVDGVARHSQAALPPARNPAPTDAWLAALTREDPTLLLPPDVSAAFQHQVDAWSDVTSYGGGADTFRLCFRLQPPEDDALPAPAGAGTWKLEYLLQATDDPSLLVPVAEVWRHRGATGRFLTRRFDQPQERVLASLGRAARHVPAIEASLHAARPEAAVLTTREAADLVRDSALLLRASGFGVLLPGLDTRLGVRLKLRSSERNAPASSSSGDGTLSFDQVIAYDWELALGDQPLTREEFEMLANLKEPLVKLRGRWLDLRPEDLDRALAFVRRHERGGTLSVAEALSTALAPTTLDGLPIDVVDTSRSWLDELIGGLTRSALPSAEPLGDPPGLHGTLRPYQQRGVAWLSTLRRFGLGGILADDMGLGKTISIIALLLHSPPGERHAPTLVVCPTSVVGNWRREVERFAPSLRVHVHHGPERARGDAFTQAALGHDVVLSTYALLHRDFLTLRQVHWSALVLDEAQNVKNAETHAARAARALQTAWRIALTGTPVENRLADLWSIFDVVSPAYLGTAEQFRQRFALPIERAGDAEAAARLKTLTAPFILRRVKTDRSVVADLPEKQEMKVYCSLTREQATLYEAVVRNAMAQIAEAQGIQRRGLVLGLLTRLKQVCDHPALLLHDPGSALAGRSGKLQRLGEMLEEVLAADERALVFTQYAEMGTLLQRHLAATTGREVFFLHGGTPMKERDRMVQRFQQPDGAGPGVFVLSLKAGGTGLNLTHANHVFHFDRWWNPAVENQATDRAFRIGQTRNVQVHKFLCAGTFEETLDDLLERKRALAEQIVGTSESWITEMDTAQLKDLFALRRDTVGEDD